MPNVRIGILTHRHLMKTPQGSETSPITAAAPQRICTVFPILPSPLDEGGENLSRLPTDVANWLRVVQRPMCSARELFAVLGAPFRSRPTRAPSMSDPFRNCRIELVNQGRQSFEACTSPRCAPGPTCLVADSDRVLFRAMRQSTACLRCIALTVAQSGMQLGPR